MKQIFALLAVISIACAAPAAIATPTDDVPEYDNQPIIPLSALSAEVTQEAVMVTAVEAVYVREEPTADAKIVGYYVSGEAVDILGCTVNEDMELWAQVKNGWINARYLSDNACQ